MITTEKKEQNRITRCLRKAGVEEARLEALKPVINQISWMYVKLSEASADMEKESLTIEYDNGGGQSGIRENPKFKAYESLWKSYISGAKLIVDALPQADVETVADTSAKPQTVLSMIQSKRSDTA